MKRMSGQYRLFTPGMGQKTSGNEVKVDAYRSPFSPSGQANFVWSDRALPLAQIVKDNVLPLVVKISEEASVRTEGDNSMDFRQPLLLYREHQMSRLYARNVTSTGSSKKEVGPYICIPQTYQGLFRSSGQTASPITSMSMVARLMPLSVLSCMTCEGYLCVSPIESDVIYQKTSLQPGVYAIKDLVEDDIRIYNGGNKSKKTKAVRCLRCINESNKMVLFPMKANGQFYVAGVDSKSSRHGAMDKASRVYHWTELTTQLTEGADTTNNNNDCDITADLVYGKPPSQECNFTGTLAFKHVIKDNTVIGCTTTETTSRLFELQLGPQASKGPNFAFALNQDCFNNDSPLARSLKFVKQEFERYVSDIKVRKDYEVESAKIRESAN